ncbi:hypothetical protein Micbo1qcDRAFT_96457, partial [Microdochium bolleyi]
RRDEYSVGWVSALPLELRAALACLDEQHETLPRDSDDHNTYAFGRIHHHNVVFACLPSGDYGNNSAANVAVHMRRSFPSIHMLLLVGIAGGVPFPADVRLGDVVVGQRIVQHDLGKQLKGGEFLHTSTTYSLHSSVGTTLSLLRASLEPQCIGPELEHLRHSYPSLRRRLDRKRLSDDLHQNDYEHEDDARGCECCDSTKLTVRGERQDGNNSVVHYGTIESGDQVVKDAKLRDRIGKTHGALCIEMEAAGLKHDFPNLVVRGICDYADSHKNKEWQDYASATAAVFAKLFLLHTATVLQPAIDSRYEDIAEPHDDTCEWIMQHPSYLDWLDPSRMFSHHGFFWIRGKAGVGKSTAMKYLFEATQEGAESDHIVLSFFFHARGSELERSTTGMYRSILFQLLREVPQLQSVLESHESPPWSLNKLRSLLSKAVAMLQTRCLTLFIDALDECHEAEGLEMVRRFQREAKTAFANAVSLRICFSSRPYPVVDMRNGLQIVLNEQEGHALDLLRYVRSELSGWPVRLQQYLENAIMGKAQGVFLWAVLVLSLLSQDLRRGRVDDSRLAERLEQLTPGLSDLFKDIIHRDQRDLEDLKLCVQWILYSAMPLSPQDYYRAMMLGLDSRSGKSPGPWNANAVTDEVLANFITSTSRGLVEATGSFEPKMQFIHQSVKDYFIEQSGMKELFRDEAHDSASCHERLKYLCRSHYDLMKSDKQLFSREHQRRFPVYQGDWRPTKIISEPFNEYACIGMLYHAERAALGFSQLLFVSTLDLAEWRQFANLY